MRLPWWLLSAITRYIERIVTRLDASASVDPQTRGFTRDST